MLDYCKRFNVEFGNYFMKLDRRRRVFNSTFTFKKPLKDFSYNYGTICPYHFSKGIQTFIINDAEIYHYLFIFSNDKESDIS